MTTETNLLACHHLQVLDVLAFAMDAEVLKLGSTWIPFLLLISSAFPTFAPLFLFLGFFCRLLSFCLGFLGLNHLFNWRERKFDKLRLALLSICSFQLQSDLGPHETQKSQHPERLWPYYLKQHTR